MNRLLQWSVACFASTLLLPGCMGTGSGGGDGGGGMMMGCGSMSHGEGHGAASPPARPPATDPAGTVPARSPSVAAPSQRPPTGPEAATYVCPMDGARRSGPGPCPTCGMPLDERYRER